MSVVIFHWETPKGFESPHAKKKLLARWGLTCKAFGIHTLYCVTQEEIVMKDAEVTFETFFTLEEALKHTEGNIVNLEEGGTPLSTFSHPEDAVYVFGSDYGALYVEKAITINAKLPLHAEVAAGIVLSHRYSQWH